MPRGIRSGKCLAWGSLLLFEAGLAAVLAGYVITPRQSLLLARMAFLASSGAAVCSLLLVPPDLRRAATLIALSFLLLSMGGGAVVSVAEGLICEVAALAGEPPGRPSPRPALRNLREFAAP